MICLCFFTPFAVFATYIYRGIFFLIKNLSFAPWKLNIKFLNYVSCSVLISDKHFIRYAMTFLHKFNYYLFYENLASDILPIYKISWLLICDDKNRPIVFLTTGFPGPIENLWFSWWVEVLIMILLIQSRLSPRVQSQCGERFIYPKKQKLFGDPVIRVFLPNQ